MYRQILYLVVVRYGRVHVAPLQVMQGEPLSQEMLKNILGASWSFKVALVRYCFCDIVLGYVYIF